MKFQVFLGTFYSDSAKVLFKFAILLIRTFSYDFMSFIFILRFSPNPDFESELFSVILKTNSQKILEKQT